MEQNYLCNMNCLFNNKLQLLIGAAAYEIGSYAGMSGCDIGHKLQVNSNIEELRNSDGTQHKFSLFFYFHTR